MAQAYLLVKKNSNLFDYKIFFKLLISIINFSNFIQLFGRFRQIKSHAVRTLRKNITFIGQHKFP